VVSERGRGVEVAAIGRVGQPRVPGIDRGAFRRRRSQACGSDGHCPEGAHDDAESFCRSHVTLILAPKSVVAILEFRMSAHITKNWPPNPVTAFT
jgi:hypothetical protein